MSVLELLDGIQVGKLPEWANPSTIRIFFASSSELRQDRDELDLYLRQENDNLIEKGIYLKIVRWENFLDAMSNTRQQDEYNKAVRDCDIFVSLFFTRTGQFTEEEFQAAYGQFLTSGKPSIFTYFKHADINTGTDHRDDLKSLWAFQDKLKALGHYPTTYKNIDDLKLQFRKQLDKLLSSASLTRLITVKASHPSPSAQMLRKSSDSSPGRKS